jgi:hypothetical protein
MDRKSFGQFIVKPSQVDGCRGTTRLRNILGRNYPVKGAREDQLSLQEQQRRLPDGLWNDYQRLAETAIIGQNEEALAAAMYLCERGCNPEKLLFRLETVKGQPVRSLRSRKGRATVRAVMMLLDYVNQATGNPLDAKCAALLNAVGKDLAEGASKWTASSLQLWRARENRGELKNLRPRFKPVVTGWPGEEPGDVEKWTEATILRLLKTT